MTGEVFPVVPAAGEGPLPVSWGKAALRPEFHAGRRTQADVEIAGQTVRVIHRPLARAGAPAVFAAAHAMIDARGSIPGRADVPLHVAVEGEQLAVGVEVE